MSDICVIISLMPILKQYPLQNAVVVLTMDVSTNQLSNANPI
jgi:hypothetical protein